MAKLSTWPLLNKWKILSPQAPIVITTKETVRVSDGQDVQQAISQIKSKISAVVALDNGNPIVMGTAANLTSDGAFVTAQTSFAGKTTDSYFVVLNDGRQAQITEKVSDLGTSLVFFKASLDSVPVAGLASSKDLALGDKLVFVQGSLENFSAKIDSGIVSTVQNDVQGQTFQSDYPSRSYYTVSDAPLSPGEALADTGGELAGLWNGTKIISSDVLKQASDLYFADSQKITRPAFGFSYSIITKNESKLSGQSEGAKVLETGPSSAARQAGLLPGDIITAINSQVVSEDSLLEEVLQKFKPGDLLTLSINRKSQPLALTFTAGDLSK